jgi:hypothetical protein
MKTALKILGAIVLGIITIVSVVGLFAPHKVVVAESVTINASAENVFEKINLWAYFKDWSPWNELDPNMKISYEGTDGTVGSVYKWEGNDEVGTGNMTKTLVQPNSRIEYDLHFMKPWESKNKGYMTVEPEGTAQKVTWGFTADAPFPQNVMMFFMKGYIADDFKKGLNKLKAVAEKES